MPPFKNATDVHVNSFSNKQFHTEPLFLTSNGIFQLPAITRNASHSDIIRIAAGMIINLPAFVMTAVMAG